MTLWARSQTAKDKFCWYNFISSFFLCGHFWIMPGTFASIVAVLISLSQFLEVIKIHYLIPSLLFIFSMTLGVVATKKSLDEKEDRDPGWIVIDEVAGQSLALLIIPQTILSYLLSLALFRFFDLLKPFPIRNLEKIKGATGVFADDLAAGLFAGIIIRVIITLL
ncbi:MAG: phosphatidylglycerophosphatase A [Acidobacteria bacterium]|nr:phosphatidylglycerophosphatase A [Acidobacteriota bacterium]